MYSKKVIRAWCSYDIANSVYNLIITTVLFPIYYTTITEAINGNPNVVFMGLVIRNTVIYDYIIAAAYLVIVFISPLLSGIADYSGNKKRFMMFFTYLGALSCAGLFWFKGNNIHFGLLMAGLAVVGYAGSLVFYNSFLPLIAPRRLQDIVSARGFAWGYGGSVILLIINILLINTWETWHFASQSDALRTSFLMVGFWWASVSGFAFWYLKDAPPHQIPGQYIIVKGYHELVKVAQKLWKIHNGVKFLASYFFYSTGVQTIMLVATLFGATVLSIPAENMILTIILLQLVAMAGAHLFARISVAYSNRFSILIMLVIWIMVCISAYFIDQPVHFYFLAGAVGMVMGGIQSQSRSAFSKIIPEGETDTASFFSFYDVTEKMAIVIGMFTFGLIEHVTGNMRLSALFFSLFFITGFVLMWLTRIKTDISGD